MTQTLDVNEQFFESRTADMSRIADALASGRLRDNGDGTGTWMAGADAGERITLKTGEAITELDMTTGQAALYTRVPAWHGLGSVVPEGVTDVDEVMKLGRIDWTVEKRPVYFPMRGGLSTKAMPDQFVVVRNDVEIGLGVVGAIYEPMQNRESFDGLQDLFGDFGIVWESAGALRDGRSTFVSMKLPTDVEIELPPTALASVDVIKQFVVVLNSHDGSGTYRVLVTPWRPLCGNTERFALRDAVTSHGIRHTRNMRDKLRQVREALKLTGQYFVQFAREEQALAEAELTMAAFADVIDVLWEPPKPGATARSLNYAADRRNKLLSLWAEEADALGRTAYAGERAVTRYLDNERPVRGARAGDRFAAVRATRVLEQADDAKKTQAHKLLLQRV